MVMTVQFVDYSKRLIRLIQDVSTYTYVYTYVYARNTCIRIRNFIMKSYDSISFFAWKYIAIYRVGQ